jgi:hypothetical protein
VYLAKEVAPKMCGSVKEGVKNGLWAARVDGIMSLWACWGRGVNCLKTRKFELNGITGGVKVFESYLS